MVLGIRLDFRSVLLSLRKLDQLSGMRREFAVGASWSIKHWHVPCVSFGSPSHR